MKRPVFVVGAPRSGTTLTAKIIGRHPEIFMPGENYYFDDIYSRRKELGEVIDGATLGKIYSRLLTIYGRYSEPEDQVRVDELKGGLLSLNNFKDCKSYEQILSRFMKVQTEFVGKKRWGNNAPRDLYNVPDIINFYPEALIIACVRDPRDFMLSYRDKWKTREGDNAERLKRLYHPVITSLQWKSSMRSLIGLKKIVPAENLFVLKYESLVDNTESSVQSVCKVLGVDYHADMLNVASQNSSAEKHGKGIFASSVGRWKDGLALEDAYIMQLIAGNEMRELGYKRNDLAVSLSAVFWKFFTAPFAVAKGLYLNRHKRGPIVPYLLSRIKPFFKH
ncbi:sulfotransferase family protein [Desulfovibrio gilichinskyi]|uniref:Sulfotransferase family protein n=1 Tax=Desulfovibrio gilichinskyi TaxID=1519643 RepID=A0A1X7ELX7_9BACT|nr:sulfotransferase [Desulfovibrio gilichinskyi]SMF36355.1 Sulfotransferase family protein [Desulfovibrio gilichinskyi]